SNYSATTETYTLSLHDALPISGKFSVFESGALLRNLRSLLAQSRPLRPTDILRANDASRKDNSTVFVDQTRLSAPLASLTTLAGDRKSTRLNSSHQIISYAVFC